jgi:aspartyl-tRNA(Asn)/glutamyl-tRNA(Gln) amidotransferase subunit B
MELVTGPDISSSQEAKAFGQELQIILRYLGVSDANMEKGGMRVEANISIRLEGEDLGTKVEIKNLNSFRVVEKAIEYEIKRQAEVLESGGQVIQETRGWDEVRKKTFSQRTKEGAAGYRYFPDPDLLPFKIRDEDLKRIKSSLVELPYQKRRRYLEEYQLPLQQINAIVEEQEKAEFFEGIIGDIRDKKFIKLASNYFTSDFFGLIQKYNLKISEIKFKSKDFINLINLILEGKIQSSQAKVILEEMVKSGASPEKIIKDKGYKQISNQDLEKVIAQILIKNKAVVEDYKNGKEKALQFLIGSAMRETKGQASPNTLKNLLRRFLK